MKHKFLTALVATVSAICLCFNLTACGGSEDAGDHEHIYTAENKCSVCGKEWEYTKTDSYIFTKVIVDGVEGYDVCFGTYYENQAVVDPATGLPSVSRVECGTPYNGKEIVLPYGHNGLPVLSVGFDRACSSETLTSIVIPDSVITIGNCPGNHTSAHGAFDNCGKLHTFRLSANIAVDETDVISLREDGSVIDWDTVWFALPSLLDVSKYMQYYGQDLQADAFSVDGYLLYMNPNAETVKIPAGTRAIAAYALNVCKNINELDIPESVVKIGPGAFYGCKNLTKATIPGHVKVVGSNAFSSCQSLKSLIFEDGVERIGQTIVQGCYALETLVVPSSVTEFGGLGTCSFTAADIADPYRNYDENGMLYIGNHFIDCIGNDSVHIREGTKTISSYAFSGDIRTVEISGSVVTIGDGAFIRNKFLVQPRDDLETVTIGEGVKKIGGEAFMFCTALKSINVPKSVTEIGSMAFYGCGTEEQPTQITYPGTVAEWRAIICPDYSWYINDPRLPNTLVVVHCSNGDCDRLGNPL